jgi:hypothetical protein
MIALILILLDLTTDYIVTIGTSGPTLTMDGLIEDSIGTIGTGTLIPLFIIIVLLRFNLRHTSKEEEEVKI